MKNTDIRNAVIERLERVTDADVMYFDGRPAVVEEDDFPAIAVYLTDAEYTGDTLDANTWQATLHIEVFLPAQVPDAELDAWMETQIYPAIAEMDGLNHLLAVMVPQGYDYQRDDSLGLWSSADMKYLITYDM